MDPDCLEYDWVCPHCGANIWDVGIGATVSVTGHYRVSDVGDACETQVMMAASHGMHFEVDRDMRCGKCSEKVEFPKCVQGYQVDLVG